MNQYEFDHTNPEHHLEIADAIRAIEETKSPKSVEYLHPDGTWRTNLCAPDDWNKAFRHRRAPVPAVKWWSEPIHVPCPCWLELQSGRTEQIYVIDETGVGLFSKFIQWDKLETETKGWAPTHLGPFKPCTIPS